VKLSPVGTSASIWPIVPTPDDRWWACSSRWNENWQGKPKYSEQTYPIATLSTINPTWPDLGPKPAAAVGSRPLTASATARHTYLSHSDSSLIRGAQVGPPRSSCVLIHYLQLQPPAHAGLPLADFSTLKMEAIRSSETSVNARSTQLHIPENDILHYAICRVSVCVWPSLS
jgi:hypothetical protein